MKIVIDIPEDVYKASKLLDVKHEDVIQIPLECIANGVPLTEQKSKQQFEKLLHDMFDCIWDREIDHPIFQDTVGELMEGVIQAYNKVAQPDFDMTEKIDKAYDDGYKQGYLQGKADYEQKNGKWINGHWDGDSNFRIDGRGNCWFVRECSNCHEEIEGKPTKYCPNCGCRMKEGD